MDGTLTFDEIVDGARRVREFQHLSFLSLHAFHGLSGWKSGLEAYLLVDVLLAHIPFCLALGPSLPDGRPCGPYCRWYWLYAHLTSCPSRKHVHIHFK